ncbi:hypothetical protein ARMGADRAFT_1034944 [Armillaria gallica]|uniref:Uncharacterized protein n=1 Tax=Armillaria gallica TaxID=47427 RepID=A0A2H3CWI9_ARMGA|nr:hypothetical protein ARMGADRAFT_1034944 [Armillaria gallica]
MAQMAKISSDIAYRQSYVTNNHEVSVKQWRAAVDDDDEERKTHPANVVLETLGDNIWKTGVPVGEYRKALDDRARSDGEFSKTICEFCRKRLHQYGGLVLEEMAKDTDRLIHPTNDDQNVGSVQEVGYDRLRLRTIGTVGFLNDEADEYITGQRGQNERGRRITAESVPESEEMSTISYNTIADCSVPECASGRAQPYSAALDERRPCTIWNIDVPGHTSQKK